MTTCIADAILKTISIKKIVNFKKHLPTVFLTAKALYFHQYSFTLICHHITSKITDLCRSFNRSLNYLLSRAKAELHAWCPAAPLVYLCSQHVKRNKEKPCFVNSDIGEISSDFGIAHG